MSQRKAKLYLIERNEKIIDIYNSSNAFLNNFEMKKLLIPLLLLLFISAKSQDKTPTPEEIRQLIAKSITDLHVAPEQVAEIKNEIVRNGKDSVAIRIYKPVLNKNLPVIYFVHGAAWVAGDLETHDNICRYLSNHLQAIVVAVDYRRAPEHKFPIPFDDCYAVMKWIYSHTKQLNGNGKLVLMGDSAGGQLVGSLCLVNANEKQPIPVLAQILVDPALDLSKTSVSYHTYSLFIDWYLNETDNANDIRISPLLSHDFKGLPQAIIVVGENDKIRNDGEAFTRNF